jgi:hypothetical protein
VINGSSLNKSGTTKFFAEGNSETIEMSTAMKHDEKEMRVAALSCLDLV